MERVTTPDEFRKAVVEAEGPVLALFHAVWCGYCQDFLPHFRGRETGPIKKVEVDLSEEINPLWDTYEVEVVPTVVLFEDGAVRARADGILGKGLTVADLDGVLAGAEAA
ncbi:MAG: thioredoxin family protein [Thermoplasmata archaeon]|nr:thioredoxin family protein [Thermoplasmata archaeon]